MFSFECIWIKLLHVDNCFAICNTLSNEQIKKHLFRFIHFMEFKFFKYYTSCDIKCMFR